MHEEWMRATDARLTSLETAQAVGEVHHKVIVERLSSIEGTLKWLVRLIIGALVLAIVGFVVSGGIAP